jgi:hypothetical protein
MNTSRPRLFRPAILGLSLGSLLVAAPLRADDQDSSTTHTDRPGFFQRLGHALFPPPRRYYYVHRRPVYPGLSYVDENGRVIMVDRPTTTAAPTVLGPNQTVVRAGDTTITLTNREPGAPYGDLNPPYGQPNRSGYGAPQPTIPLGDDRIGPQRSVQNPSDDGSKGTPKNDRTKTVEPDTSNVPLATPSKKRGFVKSPYPPYHELDATGLVSGSLAKDPTTGKIFKVP